VDVTASIIAFHLANKIGGSIIMSDLNYRVPGPLGLHVMKRSGFWLPGSAPLPAPKKPTFKSVAFPHISPDNFYSSLVDRKTKPEKMHQRKTGLCLSTAFMYILAKKRPTAYWDYAFTMFERGESQIGALSIRAGTDCKNIRLSQGLEKSMNEADWVAIASFRDSKNWFWDVDDEDEDDHASGTQGELLDWFTECRLFPKAFGKECTGIRNAGVTEKLIDHASALKKEGYELAVRINADLLQGLFGGGEKEPNHRVVLESEFEIHGEWAQFNMFSWGEVKNYVVPTIELTRNFFGFVAVHP